MQNSLDAMLSAVQASAAKKNVPLILGTVLDPEMSMATIRVRSDTDGEASEDIGTGDDVNDFLTAIAAFDIQAVVATVLRVEQEQWDGAQAA